LSDVAFDDVVFRSGNSAESVPASFAINFPVKFYNLHTSVINIYQYSVLMKQAKVLRKQSGRSAVRSVLWVDIVGVEYGRNFVRILSIGGFHKWGKLSLCVVARGIC
jgi:hypothetical protein